MRSIILLTVLFVFVPPVLGADSAWSISFEKDWQEEYIQVTDKLVQCKAENRQLKEESMDPLFIRMFRCFLKRHEWSDPSLGPVYCERCGVSAEWWAKQKAKALEEDEQFGDSVGFTPDDGPDKPGHGGKGHGHGHGRGHGKGHGKGRGKGHGKHGD